MISSTYDSSLKFPISDDFSTVHPAPACIRCRTMKRNGNGKGQVTRGSPHIDILMGKVLTEKVGYLNVSPNWWNDWNDWNDEMMRLFICHFHSGKLSQMMTDSSALLGSRLNPDPRKTRLVWREIFGGIVIPSFCLVVVVVAAAVVVLLLLLLSISKQLWAPRLEKTIIWCTPWAFNGSD